MADLQKMIVGSEGSLDYLVVAQNVNIMLGIKPLFETFIHGETKGMMLGARIRAINSTEDNVVELKGKEKGAEISMTFKAAFPAIRWSAINEKRASAVLGMIIPRSPYQIEEIREAAEAVRYYGKLVEWLQSHVPDEKMFVISVEAVTEWLRARYEEMFADYEKTYKMGHLLLHGEIKIDGEMEYTNSIIEKLLKGKPKPKLSLINGGKNENGDTVH